MKGNKFFFRGDRYPHLYVPKEQKGVLHHEVLFEDGATSVPSEMFLGRAFVFRRYLFAATMVFAVTCGLLVRAAWMQIWSGEAYQTRSDANRLREMPIWPQRGVIRDRQGRVLAENIPRFQVIVLPADVPRDPETRSAVLGEAARLLGLSVNDLLPFVHATGSAREHPLLVADRLTYPQAMAFAVSSPRLTGFRLDVRPRRRYPFSGNSESLSHLLGYVGKLSSEEYEQKRASGYFRADEIGKTGVERSYESDLRGTVGKEVNEVDARGRAHALVGRTDAKNGKDLQLTLDADLQQATEHGLKTWMKTAGASRAAAIALDPRDGSLLAAVSLPAYDNNLFSGGVSSTLYRALADDAEQPLFPRAWAGTYPSGSTVKIVIAAAALAERVITPDTSFVSVGGISVGPWFFPDWKTGGHGVTNVRKAIALSVNTFFYAVGGGYGSFAGMGVDRLEIWLRRFGLGAKTGVDLPAEASGFVPSREWKEKEKGERWFVGDTYNLSIGQGDLLVTPLQVAAYTAAIARGGETVRPHVALSAEAGGERLVEKTVAAVVQQGMRDNVLYGSGRSLGSLPFSVSGKTGTAQWNKDKRTHAWFTSYAPSDKPEIVVTVLLEEGGEGSSVAVPVAKEILATWWRLRRERGGRF